jgi:hypothetical protein
LECRFISGISEKILRQRNGFALISNGQFFLEHPTSTHMVVLLHGLGSKRRSFVPYGPALNEWAHVLLPNIDSSARDVAEKICTDVHFYVSLYHIKTVYFIGVSNGARLLQEVVPCVRDYVEVPRAVALVGPMQGTLGATWLFELLDGLLWHSYHELLGHLQYRPHVNNQELYCDNRTEWLFVASRYDPLVLPHTSALPNSNCSTVLINDRRGHCGTPVAAAPEVLQFIRSSVTVPTLQKT